MGGVQCYFSTFVTDLCKIICNAEDSETWLIHVCKVLCCGQRGSLNVNED